MARLDHFLKLAYSHRASDIHLASCEKPRMRVDGDLIPMEDELLDPKDLQDILFEILSDHERQKYLTNKNLDKSYAVKGVANFRVNLFMTRKGIAAVMRSIPSKIPSCADLGLPANIQSLLGYSKGLILVTGPTGSGKSTTLAAMIDHINSTSPGHILTAEDPVEFIHESKQSLINQREIGASCLTFADALKYALREDPDVILVGEMRDLETISLALTAAETGHLVFGTLHTRGAGASVDRIIDSFPVNQQAMVRTMLAESLLAVVSQSLLKKADGTGRVGAFEIMVVNHAISNLIREGKTFQIPNIIQTSRKEGMVLMDQYIIDLVHNGSVTAQEAAGYMESPDLLGAKVNPPKPMPKPTAPAASKTPTSTPSSKPAPAKVFVPVSAPKAATPVPKPLPAAKPIPPSAGTVVNPKDLFSEQDEETGEFEIGKLIEEDADESSLERFVKEASAAVPSVLTRPSGTVAGTPVVTPAPSVKPATTGTSSISFKTLEGDSLPERDEAQEREPLHPVSSVLSGAKKLPTPPPLVPKKKAG
jgi:twitching motility protein PilT